MSSKAWASSLFPQLEQNREFFFPILWILSGLSFGFSLLVQMRFWLYKNKYLKIETLTIPVLSVGNLTVGGTGKTPIIIYLVNLLKDQNRRVAVISRNYRSSTRGIQKVSPNGNGGKSAGKLFGDEPVLIFEKTQVPVYVGPVKSLTAKEVLRCEKVDCLFVDDGFQHLKLKNNCSILLFDVTQIDQSNFLFPRGRYREPFSGYQKADIIFWTKTNFVEAEHLELLKKQVSFSGFQVDWQFELAVIDFPWFPSLNYDAAPHFAGKQEFFNTKRFILVSAIARPEIFKKMIQDLNPKIETVEKIFRDHHQYSMADLKIILNKPLNFKHFLTTEKDFTKLKDIWPKDVPLGIVKWKLRPNKSDQHIYESIASFLH